MASRIAGSTQLSRRPILRQTDDSTHIPELLHLPTELIMVVLQELGTSGLLVCARVSRFLNQLAVQRILEDHSIPRPSHYCNLVIPFPTTTLDPLAALLISVHISKLRYVRFSFVLAPSYWDLGPSLVRITRLFSRLQSVEEVTLSFNGSDFSPKLATEPKLKDLSATFEDLLNTIVAKSCQKFRFMNSRGLLVRHYHFRKEGERNSKLLSVVGVKDYLFRRRRSSSSSGLRPDNLIVNEDWKYYSRTTITGSRVSITCPPEALQATKLTHFNIGTADILRPPFSQWTFTVLQGSHITSLTISLDTLPSAREETSFILKRLAGAVPGLTRMHIDKMTAGLMVEVVDWLNNFPLLRTVALQPFEPACVVRSLLLLPLPHQAFGPCISPQQQQPAARLQLEHLRRIEGPPQLLSYIMADLDPALVRLPRLEYVHVCYYCAYGDTSLGVPLLGKCIVQIQRALSLTSSTAQIRVHLKFDSLFSGVMTQPLSNLNSSTLPASQCEEITAGMAEIHSLRVVLPASQSEIYQGKFYPQVLGCLTLFPGLKSLRLVSNEVVDVQMSLLKSNSPEFYSFQGRCPGLRQVEIY